MFIGRGYEEQRVLAKSFGIKHCTPLCDIVWMDCSDVVMFEDPVQLPVRSEFIQRGNRYRDFYKLNDPDVIDELLNVNVSLARDSGICSCEELLCEWKEHFNANIELSTKAHRDEGQGKSLLCSFINNDVLLLFLKKCFANIGFRFTSEKPKGELSSYLGCPKMQSLKVEVPDFNRCRVDTKLFAAAARRLRGQEWDEDENICQVKELEVLEWLDEMEHAAKGGLDHVARVSQQGRLRVEHFSAEGLLHCLRISGLLRSDAKLKQVVAVVGSLINGYSEGWTEESCHVPSAPTLCKHRFTLICMLHLLMRERLEGWIEAGTEFLCSLGADSSPRSGREWMFAELYLILEEKLAAFVSAVEELQIMREISEECGQDLNPGRARELSEIIQSSVWHIVLAPSCMGAKTMGLSNTFGVVTHMLRLLCSCWRTCRQLMASVQNVCTDQGTEKGLCEVPEVDANGMFPGWNELNKVFDDAIPGSLPPMAEDAFVSMQSAVRTPGSEHLLQTIMQKVISVLPLWRWWSNFWQWSWKIGVTDIMR